MEIPRFLAIGPAHLCDPQIPIAAIRAGEGGILDLGISYPFETRAEAISRLVRHCRHDTWGLRCDLLCDERRLETLLEPLDNLALGVEVPLLLVAGAPAGEDFLKFAERSLVAGKKRAQRVFAEVYGPEQAMSAQAAGFDGLVVKGHEAGGRVSRKSSLVLLQHLRDNLHIPFWVQGGMGPQSAAAACLAGAAGVVLAEQLWLASESPLSERERRRYAQVDGSETICLGDERGQFRFFSRGARERLRELDRQLATGAPWPDTMHCQLLSDRPDALDPSANQLVAVGQAIGFAARAAAKYHTVAGILKAYRQGIADGLELAPRQNILAAGSPWAEAHGTKYPIAQGPMTRVSDVAPFCKDVAESGALPFLALALLRGPAVRRLLASVAEQLGQRSWGVGMLGFVPADLRKEQMEAVLANPPRFALIAGGRPSQAKELEDAGIRTYLHVPSRGLLEVFIRDGARNFILEGRECGGHVGPLCSFTLWQSAVTTLLDAEVTDPSEFHILFAGGIHDDFSAAMAAAIAAPLVKRGMKFGVLMGTAYLFTQEAVRSGAITEEFQRQAILCADTALVESGVGHVTRCAITPFVSDFAAHKQRLLLANATPEEVRGALEVFNVGRLRIASKGVSRKSALDSVLPSAPKDVGATNHPAEDDKARIRREVAAELASNPDDLVSVDVETQRRLGMYMIGEVAALRDRVISAAELHEQVCQGGAATLQRLARQRASVTVVPPASGSQGGEPIAIIGLGCMFPDSPNLRAYWQNIVKRFDAVREVPPDRWRVEDFFSTDRRARDKFYSKWAGVLGDVTFDPLKYHIPPNSLFSIEPVQLLALEVAGEALADAGYDRPDFPRQRTAVIMASAGGHEHALRYALRTLIRPYIRQVEGLTDEERERISAGVERLLPEWSEDTFPGILTNLIAGRISNRFDLGGTNLAVDAACASSLAAVQIAVEQLRAGACDAALAGAADGSIGAFCFMSFAKTHALSPDGRSKSFDAEADGIGLGEGIGAVVLKRLRDAERDGDVIHAVIRGIGSSSDGRNRSLTAPSPPGQRLALERAYRDAGVSPASISFIEAHSTGTTVGDQAECEALTEFLSQSGARPRSCAVGSVKSMIGHTKAAAGLASLIKMTMALEHRILPPTIHVEKPNKVLCDPATPLYVNTENRPWFVANGQSPRRTGISAFGFGGTNFHAVLEEYGGAYHAGFQIDLNPRPCEVFAWRRPVRGEILQTARELAATLAQVPSLDLAELAAAVHNDEAQREQTAHGESRCRLAIVATSVADLAQKLTAAVGNMDSGTSLTPASGIHYSELPAVGPEEVCFLFPGQGSQSVNMLRDLVVAHPELHAMFEMADAEAQGILEHPLSSYIYPPPVFDDSEPLLRQAINETRVAQPALAVVDLFCFELTKRYGIQPAMVAGHSFGEYVALSAAGSLSQRDLFRVSAMRGQAAHQAGLETGGAMAAIGEGVEEVMKALRELGIEALPANINAPHQTVIAGSVQAIDAAVAKLRQKRISARKLAVTGAFHTPALAEAAQELAVRLAAVPFQTPRCKVFSNTTADVYPNHADDMRRLLTRHMVEPVRFQEQVLHMYEQGARLFIEVGPGSVLTNLTSRILEERTFTALAAAPNGQDGWQGWGTLVASLIALGLPVRLERWFQHRRLPTCGVNDLVAREKARHTPKATDWTVNSARARPVSGMAQPGLHPAEPSETLQTQSADTANGRQGGNDPSAATAGNGHDRRADATPSVGTRLPARSRSAATPAAPVSLDQSQRAAARPRPAGTSQPLPSRFSGRRPMTNNPTNQSMVPANPSVSDGNDTARIGVLGDFSQVMSQWLELQARQVQAQERFLETHERVTLAYLAGPQDLPPLSVVTELAPPRLGTPLESVASSLHRPVASRVSAPSRPSQSAPAPIPRRVAPAKVEEASPASPPSSTNGGLQGERATSQRLSSQTAPPPEVPPSASRVPSMADSSLPPPTEEFRKELLAAVSERTGYPPEMLKEDALLETDLGIDSIKTVEVFGLLTRYHQFMPGSGGMDEELLGEFAKLKTLGDIIAMYDRGRSLHLKAATAGQLPAPSGTSSSPAETPRHEVPLQRLEVTAVSAPALAGGIKKNSPPVMSS